MFDDWFILGALFARRSSPAELTIAAWSVVAIVGGFGAVCFYFGWQAPAEKAAQGGELMFWGGVLMGVAGLIWLGYRFVLYLLER